MKNIWMNIPYSNEVRDYSYVRSTTLAPYVGTSAGDARLPVDVTFCREADGTVH